MASSMPIHVVNLARSQGRREQIIDQLERLGLSYKLFEAVDGRELSDTDYESAAGNHRLRYFEDRLTRGQLGCYLSHLRLFEAISRASEPMACVIEDDAALDPELPLALAALAERPNFDLVWLCGGSKGKRGVAVGPLIEGRTLVRPYESKSTTQAYVVTRRGASRLARHCAAMIDPIDIRIKRYWDWNGDVFCVHPPLVRDQEGHPSTLGDLRAGQSLGLKPLGALRRQADEAMKTIAFTRKAMVGARP